MARLALWFVFAIGGLGALHPFLAVVLRERGLSSWAAAAVLALSPLASLLLGPAWAVRADRLADPVRVLRAATAGMVLGTALMVSSPGLVGLIAGFALLVACRSGALPLGDVVALQAVGGDRYGPVRMWGSLAFAAAALGVGASRESWPAAPLVTATAFGVGLLATTWRLPRAAPLPPRPLGAVFRRLLADPSLRGLALVAVLHGLTVATYDHLFSVHADAVGMPGAWLGGAVAFGVACEVLVLAGAPWLLRRFGPDTLILVGVAAGILRWSLTATLTAPWALALTQGLHGLCFGAWWVGAVAAVAGRAPLELKGSAQGLLFATAGGVGPLAALALGGVVLEVASSRVLFGINAALSLAATALLLLSRDGWRLGAVPEANHPPPRRGV